MHVFTYGTLMFPEVWRAVAGRMFASVEGMAAGYAVFRVRDAVFPGMIAAADDCVVRGILYLDVDRGSLRRLDKFEDDFYERQAVWIDCDDGERRQGEAYIVPAKNRHVLADEPWDRDAFIASGGLEHFVSRFPGFDRIADND